MGADGVKVVAEKIGSQPANRLVHEDLGYALFAKVANALCARNSRRISSFPRPGSDALNRRNDFDPATRNEAFDFPWFYRAILRNGMRRPHMPRLSGPGFRAKISIHEKRGNDDVEARLGPRIALDRS